MKRGGRVYKAEASTGTTNLENIFKKEGVSVKVDYFFKNILRRLNQNWTAPQFRFTITHKPAGAELNTELLLHLKGFERQELIFSFLTSLAGKFSSLLDIPTGEEEVNLVFAYIEDLDVVLFVEHEIENDREEFHLHAVPPEELQRRKVKIAYFI